MGSVPKSSKLRFEQFLKESRARAHAAVIRWLPKRLPPQRHREATGSGTQAFEHSPNTQTYPQNNALQRYREWLAPGLRDLFAVIALGLAAILLDLIWPYLSAELIDRVVLSRHIAQSTKLRYLVLGALLMALVFFVGAIANYARSLRLQLLSQKLQIGLRGKLFARILRLPLTQLQDHRTGGLLSRLSSDVEQTSSLVQQAFLSPLLALVRLASTLVIIFSLNRKIAAAVVLALPPILFLQAYWSRRLRVVYRSISQDRQEMDGRVGEALSGIRVVRAFRGELREQTAQRVSMHTIARKQLLATRTQRILSTVWDLILPLTQVIIVCYGGYLVVVGQTTLGRLIAFQGYLWRLIEPVLSLANAISDTQRGLAAMDRVFELLERPAEKPDLPTAIDAPSPVKNIRFRDVTFAYREGYPVISNFNLEIRGGTTVALVGASGAGKTTLTDLLARFHDPSEGRIELNDRPLPEYRLASYRRLLGIVSQEVFLFDGTVRENIAYAKPHAEASEVTQAARLANAHDFIVALPDGYDTLVGERGVKLSGGQRQRLSIARALLANPEILILDEATSNLDTESEQLIQEAQEKLTSTRTTLVVAHRLSTVKKADHICVIEQGRLVEQGTHTELLASNGLYASMVARQHHVALAPSDAPSF